MFDNFTFQNDFEISNKQKEEKVHIRLQKRNGKKSIITIQGLADDLDLKKISKHFKKLFNCNTHVKHDEKYGDIILVQGDHREEIKLFLIKEEIIDKEMIIIHGY